MKEETLQLLRDHKREIQRSINDIVFYRLEHSCEVVQKELARVESLQVKTLQLIELIEKENGQ